MTSGPLFRTVRARLTLMHVRDDGPCADGLRGRHLRARPHQHLERARRAPAERLPLGRRNGPTAARRDSRLVRLRERSLSPWLQVWSPEGESLFRTALARRVPVPGTEALTQAPDGRIVSLSSSPDRFRVLTGQVTIAGHSSSFRSAPRKPACGRN